jgi:hypothetical protein
MQSLRTIGSAPSSPPTGLRHAHEVVMSIDEPWSAASFARRSKLLRQRRGGEEARRSRARTTPPARRRAPEGHSAL